MRVIEMEIGRGFQLYHDGRVIRTVQVCDRCKRTLVSVRHLWHTSAYLDEPFNPEALAHEAELECTYCEPVDLSHAWMVIEERRQGRALASAMWAAEAGMRQRASECLCHGDGIIFVQVPQPIQLNWHNDDYYIPVDCEAPVQVRCLYHWKPT